MHPSPPNHGLPKPTQPNHFLPPQITQNPVFYALGRSFFLHRPGRKNSLPTTQATTSTGRRDPSNATEQNRTPYASINPQTAPAGSRITQNLPSPIALGPSTISPPSSVTRSTLESRFSTLM